MNDTNTLLKNITDLSDELQQKFYLLGIEIENKFLQIKSSASLDEAAQYFDQLQTIQEKLAKLIFRDLIKVPNYLWDFIRKFDRLDDDELRKHVYREIKEGPFLFKRQ